MINNPTRFRASLYEFICKCINLTVINKHLKSLETSCELLSANTLFAGVGYRCIRVSYFLMAILYNVINF